MTVVNVTGWIAKLGSKRSPAIVVVCHPRRCHVRIIGNWNGSFRGGVLSEVTDERRGRENNSDVLKI